MTALLIDKMHKTKCISASNVVFPIWLLSTVCTVVDLKYSVTSFWVPKVWETPKGVQQQDALQKMFDYLVVWRAISCILRAVLTRRISSTLANCNFMAYFVIQTCTLKFWFGLLKLWKPNFMFNVLNKSISNIKNTYHTTWHRKWI